MEKTISRWWQSSLAQGILIFLAVVAAGIGLWARFWHLGSITTPIFDEVYFPVFANDFLHHQLAFDVHPPLGKLLMAIGIYFFGNTPVGWRIVPAVFGLLNIAVLLWIWRLINDSRVGSWLMLMFSSLDGLLIVYSRTGLIDGILLDLILVTFALALQVGVESSLLWLAIALGLACAVKWIALGVVVPVLYLMWRKRRLAEFILQLPLSFLVYYAVVMLGELIGRVAHPLAAAWQWQADALNYQLTLTATHPYASRWWSWPLELRPVLFYYTGVGHGETSVIIAMTNPVLLGATDLAVLVTLFYLLWRLIRREWSVLDHPLAALFVGYLALWLPFAPIHRVLFLYHYMPAYALALLMLVYWLSELWKRQAWIVVAIAAIILATCLYFLPFAIGTPLSAIWLKYHIWYYHWIY